MTAPHHHHSAGHRPHGLSPLAEAEGVSDRRLLWSVIINQLLTVVQVVAGLWAGSVALLADAAHNFNDANALLIAYGTRRIARRKPDEQYTFGYRRAELIGSTVNLTLLGIVGLYLLYEGLHRLLQPEPIIGPLMAAAAAAALIVDVATTILLWSLQHGSLNLRAAFLHNLVDALGSLAVLLGAAAVTFRGWTWIDPLLAMLIAGYVLWQVALLFPQTARILMEGAPVGLDLDQLIACLQEVDGVRQVHHLHAWQLDENHRALEAHVVVAPARADELEEVKRQLKSRLAEEYDITHSTLEFEFPHSLCEDGDVLHCPPES